MQQLPRITIAILAAPALNEMVDAVRRFGDLTVNTDFTRGETPEFGRDETYAHSLEEALTGLLSFDPAFRLVHLERFEICPTQGTATLRYRDGEVYFDGSAEEMRAIYGSDGASGVQEIRFISRLDLLTIASGLSAHLFPNSPQ